MFRIFLFAHDSRLDVGRNPMIQKKLRTNVVCKMEKKNDLRGGVWPVGTRSITIEISLYLPENERDLLWLAFSLVFRMYTHAEKHHQKHFISFHRSFSFSSCFCSTFIVIVIVRASLGKYVNEMNEWEDVDESSALCCKVILRTDEYMPRRIDICISPSLVSFFFSHIFNTPPFEYEVK